jgi:hypothetical protein
MAEDHFCVYSASHSRYSVGQGLPFHWSLGIANRGFAQSLLSHGLESATARADRASFQGGSYSDLSCPSEDKCHDLRDVVPG